MIILNKLVFDHINNVSNIEEKEFRKSDDT